MISYTQLVFLLLCIGLVVAWLRLAKDTKTKIILLLMGFLLLIVWVQAAFMNTYLTANGHRYRLLVATSSAAQEQGLGGRHSLPVDQGMLFVFHDEAVRCLWMKDMHFPLDMLWLNSAKQVVYMETSVSPATYPTTFCPVQPAAYVLELNAGQVQHANIRLGDTLSF